MRATRVVGILSLVVACVAGTLVAQAAASGADTTIDVHTQAGFNALLAMSPAERRAFLSNLDYADRRGIWFEVQKALLAKKGIQPRQEDPNNRLEGYPVDVKPPAQPLTKNTVGTITYDSGFPTIGFGGGALVGNRFNTHTGIPVCNPGTVSTIRALVVPGPANATSSAGFVLEGPQTTMGGAMALFSTFTGATGVVDSLTFAGLGVTYTGSSFFVIFGDFATVYIPVFGTGTTLGQGHHGVVGYTGGMGPNITGTFDFGGSLNSFVRASGVIVPVELLKFEVE